jgi:hypothetical protein
METSFTSSNDGQVAVWQLQGSTCVNLFGSGVPASDSPCRIRLQISLKSLTLEKCTIETQVAYLCYHGWRLFLVPKCFQRRWIDLVWTQKKFGRESWLQRLRLGQVCDKQTHDNSMEWGSSLRSSFTLRETRSVAWRTMHRRWIEDTRTVLRSKSRTEWLCTSAPVSHCDHDYVKEKWAISNIIANKLTSWQNHEMQWCLSTGSEAFVDLGPGWGWWIDGLHKLANLSRHAWTNKPYTQL